MFDGNNKYKSHEQRFNKQFSVTPKNKAAQHMAVKVAD